MAKVGGGVRVGSRTLCRSNTHLGNTHVFSGIIEWWYQVIRLKRAMSAFFKTYKNNSNVTHLSPV